jgi:hypothetical protein
MNEQGHARQLPDSLEVLLSVQQNRLVKEVLERVD